MADCIDMVGWCMRHKNDEKGLDRERQSLSRTDRRRVKEVSSGSKGRDEMNESIKCMNGSHSIAS